MLNSSMWKAAIAIAALAVITGCQKPKDETPTVGINQPGQKLKIVYIPKSTGNAYFTDVISGFQEATKETGDEFTTTAPADAKSPQIPLIKEQIQRKVDVIVVSASSPDALNGVLDEARSKGILVMTVDADLTGNESHRDAAVLQTDSANIGKSQIELLGSQMNYEGNFAILSATRDAPNQNAWIEAMKETLKEPKYSKMQLVEVVYGDDDAVKSTTEFEALLSKHPGRLGVISPTSVGLAAAAKSLEIAKGPRGAANPVFLTGLSTPNQMKSFIESGTVQAFQLWSPHDMGYIAAHLAHQIKSGQVKAGDGVKFTAGKLGERSFGKDNIVIAGPLVTFDKSNIAKYNF